MFTINIKQYMLLPQTVVPLLLLNCCYLVAKLCLTLCNPMGYSLPGSSVHGILQARILGVGCHALLQRNLPNPGIKPTSLMPPVLAGGFFTTSTTWEAT